MRRLLLLATLLLPPAARGQSAAALTALMQRHQVPGMQVVYAHGRHWQTYSLGVRGGAGSELVTDTTIFEAASLGKAMLAYVALRLHDQGVLDLDRPLLDYYDYPRVRGQARAARVTARLVLTHTAGLPNWAVNPTGADWATSPLSFKYAPDSCWNYSGEGYAWLQQTLEHLTGRPWEALAREYIFQPFRLAHSTFAWRPALAASAGHAGSGQPVPIDHFAAPYAAYSLYSTATDYSRFLTVLRTGRGLRPATAQLLRVPATPANRCGQPASATDPYIDWACGVGLAATSRGRAQWQWGDNTSFKGFFMTLPGRKESLILLTNSANGDQLVDEVLALFFGPGEYRAAQWLRE